MSTFSLQMTRHSEHECGPFLLPAQNAAIVFDATLSARLNTLRLRRAFAHAHFSAYIHIVSRGTMCELQAYEEENVFKAHFSDIDFDVSAYKRATHKKTRPDHDHIDLLREQSMWTFRMVNTETWRVINRITRTSGSTPC